MAKLLLKIDNLSRADHEELDDEDLCYYLGEYIANAATGDVNKDSMNSIIHNIKKKPSNPNANGFHYKASTIKQLSKMLTQIFLTYTPEKLLIVPVPPSKAKLHKDYDDRMLQIASGILNPKITILELVEQIESYPPFHESASNRVNVDELCDRYKLCKNICPEDVDRIAIMDDVLTSGTHYKAMKKILSKQYPNAQIWGLFIARRVYPNQDIASLFEDLGDED